jgi:hypothetical protein
MYAKNPYPYPYLRLSKYEYSNPRTRTEQTFLSIYRRIAIISLTIAPHRIAPQSDHRKKVACRAITDTIPLHMHTSLA